MIVGVVAMFSSFLLLSFLPLLTELSKYCIAAIFLCVTVTILLHTKYLIANLDYLFKNFVEEGESLYEKR